MLTVALIYITATLSKFLSKVGQDGSSVLSAILQRRPVEGGLSYQRISRASASAQLQLGINLQCCHHQLVLKLGIFVQIGFRYWQIFFLPVILICFLWKTHITCLPAFFEEFGEDSLIFFPFVSITHPDFLS